MQKVNNHGYVYFLIDPRYWNVRYVGSTNNPNHRKSQHLSGMKTAGKSLMNWLDELRILKLEPVMVIVEECQSEDRKVRERYWIREILYRKTQYHEPCDLLNEQIRTAYLENFNEEGRIANIGVILD